MASNQIKNLFSTNNKSMLMSYYNSISQEEKISIIKSLKECLEEYPDLKQTFSFLKSITTISTGLTVIAILISAEAMLLLPLLGLTSMAINHKRIDELFDCVRRKRRGEDFNEIPSASIERLPESYRIKTNKMKKTIRLTESELIKLIQKVIKEDEMSSGLTSSKPTKEVTLSKLGIKEPSYMTNLNGTTPFYVNGKEQKKNITIKPTDRLACKNCLVDFVTEKTNKNFTLAFDKEGNASIRY